MSAVELSFPRPVRRRRERTHEEVLDSAGRDILTGGVESVRVAQVMQRVGKTHGGFYLHFESRDELIRAAVERLLGRPMRLFEDRSKESHGVAGVAGYVLFYLSPEHREGKERGCPMPTLLSDLPRMDPSSRTALDRTIASLAQAIDDRLLRADEPAPCDVVGAVAEMIGALALARAIGKEPLSDRILASARTSVLAKLGLQRFDPGVLLTDDFVEMHAGQTPATIGKASPAAS